MDFHIRDARKNDAEQMLDLIKELADFEKEGHEVELTAADLLKDGFESNPAFKCFVAEKEDKIAGIAIVYMRYSTWKGKILHLEDLVVSKNYRGQGIGTSLLDEVVKYGKQLGVKRVNWEVLDWNEPAINFYEKKGAKVLRDWNVVQLNEQGINDYLAKL